MDMAEFSHIVWCDLEVVVLKVHSSSPWDTTMVNTCRVPDQSKPTVNVYLCRESDAVFDDPRTYREKIMREGSYRGHTFGPPARLKWIDQGNVALAHPNPGKIIWSYVIKYVLTVFAMRANLLHLKGAAVAHEGRAFLFLGRGGSGKTEIVKALCANGSTLMANTHLLVDGGAVRGVRSTMRVRDNGRDVYVSTDGAHSGEAPEGWVPIGGVFWVKFRTDGVSIVEAMPSSCAYTNLQSFAEAVRNWELKEDIADHFGSDPFEFAEHMNRVDKTLNDFCQRNAVYYANLDIFSREGRDRLMSAMGTVGKAAPRR